MKKYAAIIGPTLLILVWILVTRFGLVNTFFLPGPFVTLKRLVQLLGTASFIEGFFLTLRRVMLAFVIGLLFGWPLGLVLSASRKVYRSVEFVIDFFRSTPATALFPLFLLIFGVTDTSKVAVASFTSMLLIVFNTAHGVMRASRLRVEAVRIMGATKLQIFRTVLFWESLPQTFIGLRGAVSSSLVVVIVTEMFIGTLSGLGRRIVDSQITYDIPGLYATILLSGVLGYALNEALVLLEKRFLRWYGK